MTTMTFVPGTLTFNLIASAILNYFRMASFSNKVCLPYMAEGLNRISPLFNDDIREQLNQIAFIYKISPELGDLLVSDMEHFMNELGIQAGVVKAMEMHIQRSMFAMTKHQFGERAALNRGPLAGFNVYTA